MSSAVVLQILHVIVPGYVTYLIFSKYRVAHRPSGLFTTLTIAGYCVALATIAEILKPAVVALFGCVLTPASEYLKTISETLPRGLYYLVVGFVGAIFCGKIYNCSWFKKLIAIMGFPSHSLLETHAEFLFQEIGKQSAFVVTLSSDKMYIGYVKEYTFNPNFDNPSIVMIPMISLSRGDSGKYYLNAIYYDEDSFNAAEFVSASKRRMVVAWDKISTLAVFDDEMFVKNPPAFPEKPEENDE